MSDTYFELPVKVREYGGAYIARCQGMTASCTSSADAACKAAVAKAMNGSGKLRRVVTPAEVELKQDDTGEIRARVPVVESGVGA